MNDFEIVIPDARDGLTRRERVVLYVLHEIQNERGDQNVPTAMLWGRVCEHFYVSPEDLSLMLARSGRAGSRRPIGRCSWSASHPVAPRTASISFACSAPLSTRGDTIGVPESA